MAKRSGRRTGSASKGVARSRRTRSTPSRRAQDAEPIVVYIHGIGRQVPPSECKLGWDMALFGRSLGARSRMAYWSRYPHDSQGRTRALGAGSIDSEDVADIVVADLVREAGVPKGRQRAASEYAAALLERIAAHHEPAGSRRTLAVHSKVLPLPRPMREWITKQLARALIKDTAAYFYDAREREKMRKSLIDQLRAANAPIVLVAHSQGSVIAYDVLTTLRPSIPIRHWITIGSPLGLDEVQDNLERLLGTSRLRVPAAVERWSNFADLLDPVAADKRLADDFQPARTVEDGLVVNANTLSISDFNPHSSTGYLATRPVQKTVEHALGTTNDRLARFVIARDVCRDAIARSGERHGVLIEIRDDAAFAAAPSLQGRAPMDDATTLEERGRQIERAIAEVADGVPADVVAVDRLRRFVAARLTASELMLLAERETELPIYSIWKNSRKRALLHRSTHVIQAPPAQIGYKAFGDGINWAVLDTGLQWDHPHFAGRVESLWDCTKLGPPRSSDKMADPDGHGTHVAGIIAGELALAGAAGVSEQLSGVAPRARLRAYRVLDENGEGDDGWIIKALDHIAETNERSSSLVIHGVNLSLGGPFDPEMYGCGHSPLCQELRRLWRQGVVVCVACGNEGMLTIRTTDGDFDLTTGHSVGDPANLEECIAVGSINADKPHVHGISYFSSRGPTADGRLKPDVVAPGERIRSCNSKYRPGKRFAPYVENSGTSMACPHVSGLVAAFLSVRREFIGRPDDVKRILLANCVDLGRDRYHQGAGLPNLVKMLANT